MVMSKCTLSEYLVVKLGSCISIPSPILNHQDLYVMCLKSQFCDWHILIITAIASPQSWDKMENLSWENYRGVLHLPRLDHHSMVRS